MDSLSKKGVFYKNCISNAPYTTASLKALHTSTYPLLPRESYTDISKRLTLAEVLRAHGFLTIGIHSNPWLSLYRFNKGFVVFKDPLEEYTKNFSKAHKVIKKIIDFFSSKLDERSAVRRLFRRIYYRLFEYEPFYARAEEINDAISLLLSKISALKNKKKLFLWVHYMDTHEPYVPKHFYFCKKIEYYEIQKLMEKRINNPEAISEKEKRLIKDLYDSEIRYVDENLKKLIDYLSEILDFERTILVITSDHGEALGERGVYGHGGCNRKILFTDALLKVPLIFWSENTDIMQNLTYDLEIKEADSNKLIGLIDLAPTILDLVNIRPPHSFLGKSFKNFSRDAIISQGIQCYDPNQQKYFKYGERIHSYRTKKYKLIYYESSKKVELYDLTEDPIEERNIYNERTHIAIELKKKLIKELERIRIQSFKTSISKSISRTHKL